MIDSDTISGKIGKEVFEEMFVSKKSPEDIVKEKGIIQLTDSKELENIIDKIIEKNKKEVKQYKEGKTKLLGFFVGQAMKESQGKANPKKLNEILIKKLK